MKRTREQIAAAQAAILGTQAKPSKWKNKRTFAHGYWFASRREAKRYGQLLLLQQAGHIHALKRQVKFTLNVNGVHVANYVADFQYCQCAREECTDGDLIARVVEDSKGARTREFAMKSALMRALYAITVLET